MRIHHALIFAYITLATLTSCFAATKSITAIDSPLATLYAPHEFGFNTRFYNAGGMASAFSFGLVKDRPKVKSQSKREQTDD